MENLETLAASLAQKSPTTGTVQTESIPGYNISNSLVHSSSTATLEDCQNLPLSDHTTSALNTWDPTTHLITSDNTLSPRSIWDSTIWGYTSQLSRSDISSSILAISDSLKQISPSETSSSAQSVWVPPTHVDPSIFIHDNQQDNLDQYGTTTAVKCNCPNPHIQVETHGPGPYSCTEVRILMIGTVAPALDLYANHLRLETICTLAAMDTLRMHVGLTEEMVCAAESPSPFYRSIRASADGTAKENIICTVQRIFKTLKPDLRPSSDQITIDHPPFIDVLPFRTLRKNLIFHQKEVNEDEFLRDAITGLVCWGGAGVGRKDRDASTGYASSGTPWDSRSWEAKVWFLRKYWSLLGGDEGELVRQSEWWRSIRGEDLIDIEALASNN
ncbi:uncharacterized protein N7443_000349 [Penicillium atrosanguineum]|uniref:uncharacterized protein n=1 Tax=Penicillium atrosanguineum TaxID=1132637 RepID=UPI0023A66A91|nr:uncharacterized protein N7443_000349 [Penicillium atrosanguineum]KAJ5313465.1 hypothetical protein N7443_000349 [Penicillium atrosanguineum]